MSNQSCTFSNSSVTIERTTFTVLYSVIIVLGLSLNVLALWIFCFHIQQRSGTTFYMMNLAIVDIFLVCFLPFRIVAYYREDRLSCEIAGIIFLINMYTSIFFLACISLDRCLATVLPFKVRIYHLRRAAPWVSGLVWLLTVGCSLPTYLRWKFTLNVTSSYNCLEPIVVTNELPRIFTLAIGFGLPYGLVLTSSLLALVKMRKAKLSLTLNIRKTQNMILANFLVFTFCFLPYHAFLVLYRKENYHWNCSSRLLFQITQILASANTVFDPMIYYFTTEAFQKTHLMKTVRNMFCCKSSTEEQEKYSVQYRESYKKSSEASLFL
ncbi:lysophosphatidic acid receptor 4-like [Hemiscyllium ocellatum]|uniref:lysophosphatidic acid receptor 4-like n=1 Tax=Hemiscyllium ocellatum TaxID=170820 RepID=UPI002967240B|nr:lysophosphatidic acid receptor 4-like [Hemiscyllium ocellatum]XP_060710483.1 lysophosphatidic acid receptor 4-like [Hemiscyllium ocellatum]XP_060710484.1 lysophosphatidic acid receptor 4-like [Hemiscyllium ocellatum]XP_060710485.1 lysophosphatidic acid receptor 4-like [Hemiscyllium ocellatum]